MLSFSKGFNNQNNVDTNKYAKMGRFTPDEIIQKRYENNMKNMNHSQEKQLQQQMQTSKQVNNGAKLYNQFNAYNRNLNK